MNARAAYRTPRSTLSAVTLMSGTRAVTEDISRLHSSVGGRRQSHDYTEHDHPRDAGKRFHFWRSYLRRIELFSDRFRRPVGGYSSVNLYYSNALQTVLHLWTLSTPKWHVRVQCAASALSAASPVSRRAIFLPLPVTCRCLLVTTTWTSSDTPRRPQNAHASPKQVLAQAAFIRASSACAGSSALLPLLLLLFLAADVRYGKPDWPTQPATYVSPCSLTISRTSYKLTLTLNCTTFPRIVVYNNIERGRNTATVAFPSKDLVSGTVYLLSCELQSFHRLYSQTNWKLICSTSRDCFSAFAVCGTIS